VIYFFNKLDGSEIPVKFLDYGCLNRRDWRIPVEGPHPMMLLKVAGDLTVKDPESPYNQNVEQQFNRFKFTGLVPCEDVYRRPGAKVESRPFKERSMLDRAEGISFFFHQKKDAHLVQYLTENASVSTVRDLMAESALPVMTFSYSPKTDETLIYIFSKPDEIAEAIFRQNLMLHGGLWHWRKITRVSDEVADFSLGLSSILMLLARLECSVTVLNPSSKKAIVPCQSVALAAELGGGSTAGALDAAVAEGLDVATDDAERPFISTADLFSGSMFLAWGDWRKRSLEARHAEPALGPR